MRYSAAMPVGGVGQSSTCNPSLGFDITANCVLRMKLQVHFELLGGGEQINAMEKLGGIKRASYCTSFARNVSGKSVKGFQKYETDASFCCF